VTCTRVSSSATRSHQARAARGVSASTGPAGGTGRTTPVQEPADQLGTRGVPVGRSAGHPDEAERRRRVDLGDETACSVAVRNNASCTWCTPQPGHHGASLGSTIGETAVLSSPLVSARPSAITCVIADATSSIARP